MNKSDKILNKIKDIKESISSTLFFRILNIVGLYALFLLSILYTPKLSVFVIIAILLVILIAGVKRWFRWANK